MKLRISGASLRLRLLRKDVDDLLAQGQVVETIQLGAEEGCSLRYLLLTDDAAETVALRYRPQEIAIVVPRALAESWAASEQVGIYATAELGERGRVELLVEKDFACLDASDAENQDTFPNPQMGAPC